MIVIGRNSFEVPAPDGMRTFALQKRIIPVAGRVAGVFLSLMEQGAEVADIGDVEIAKLLPVALPRIGHVFSEMPPGELEWLTRELLRDAKFGDADKHPSTALFGSPGGDAFGALMRGRTVDAWRLLWHALEVWYPDFFIHARALTARTDVKANPSAESLTSSISGQASA